MLWTLHCLAAPGSHSSARWWCIVARLCALQCSCHLWTLRESHHRWSPLPAPRDRANGMEGQIERFGRVVNNERRAIGLELGTVGFFIGSKKGTVHQHATTHKVEPPVPRAHKRAGHYRLRGRLPRVGHGRKYRGSHLAEAAQQRIAGAAGRQPTRADASIHLPLFHEVPVPYPEVQLAARPESGHFRIAD